MKKSNLDVLSTLAVEGGSVQFFSLEQLEKKGYSKISRMPVTVKIFLESVLRHLDGKSVTEEHLHNLIRWRDSRKGDVPFQPARVLMQDLTGVPAVVDLAVMRDALAELGGDSRKINPIIPVDLVIDHSVQVDRYGTADALAFNAKLEFQRNRERYEILNWASKAFDNLTVVPPATGICHQVNLEYLAKVVQTSLQDGRTIAFPDSLLGTDSHTTMINGLGVLGWGVGGIEAEAAILGQPLFMPIPEVIGFRFYGRLGEGTTATDLVLRVTEMLRKHGVVGRFIEFIGPGLAGMSLPDRATISNMCPEYGATAALFPVDSVTLEYLRNTGRDPALIDLAERYTKAQGMFRTPDTPEPDYAVVLELDLGSVEPSISGPKRPQDRLKLSQAKGAFRKLMTGVKAPQPGTDGPRVKASSAGAQAPGQVTISLSGREETLRDGSVVIAAITSCTNTSNPSVMVGAGLLAKNAVELGLRVSALVKTSLAPGSRVVSRYLELSGLMPYLETLGFHLVGFGCTTCIGNSGPLNPKISQAVKDNNLIVASVLSGNRNFEGRIHPEVRANYLASPILVVAYALAGRVDIDLESEPLGRSSSGEEVHLSDIWPDQEAIKRIVSQRVTPQLFREEYGNVYTGNETWNKIEGGKSERFHWEPTSTYIRKPPFFGGLTAGFKTGAAAGGEPPSGEPIKGARVLVLLGDSITTDHISPAGAISRDSPAAKWLLEHNVPQEGFNTYGSRRGNHEVMIRGTFGNIRIRNQLVPDTEGGYTVTIPEGKKLPIYEAAVRYAESGTPLIVIAGKDYGMGSSRDWAAKGTLLLGVRAVLAESFERIHRSNLVGMGVLPLQFQKGKNAARLGLSGFESFDIEAIREPGQVLKVRASGKKAIEFSVHARIDNAVELGYFRNGGILHTLLRRMIPDIS